MVITPNSKVKLIKNPLKLDSNNEITFNNATDQYNYFNSLPKLEFDNLTYIRKDNILRIETDDNLTFEDLLDYNFCMYQNTHFDNKWFYAFITDITWINPGLTELKLETAYFQTWQFDIIYGDCFIEREHVDNDTIGLHTLPEDVETGDYLPIDTTYISYQSSDYDDFYTCVGVTEDIITGSSGIHFYGNVPNGLTYMVIKKEDLIAFFSKYANAGKNEAINCIFIIPGAFVNGGVSFTWLENDNIHYFIPNSSTGSVLINTIYLSRPNQLGTTTKYTPRNNKLLTKQFNFIIGDNLVGGTAPYYYEYFYNPNQCGFTARGVLTPGCSIKCHPIAYKYTDDGQGAIIDNSSFSEGLTASKLPIGSWNSDVFTNWLTQNGVNIGLSVASDSIQIANGMLMTTSGSTANSGVSNIISGYLNVARTMAQIYQHSLMPKQVEGNTNTGDIVFASQKSITKYYRMTIKAEFAKCIDGYFSMYGYKVNRVGTPHIKVRTYYDYIKTIDVNLEGNIPENDLNQIRNMFNNGIRFWHNTQYYLNFNVNNTIAS